MNMDIDGRPTCERTSPKPRGLIPSRPGKSDPN